MSAAPSYLEATVTVATVARTLGGIEALVGIPRSQDMNGVAEEYSRAPDTPVS